MPGGASSQSVSFQQNYIGHSHFGQVVNGLTAQASSSNHHRISWPEAGGGIQEDCKAERLMLLLTYEGNQPACELALTYQFTSATESLFLSPCFQSLNYSNMKTVSILTNNSYFLFYFIKLTIKHSCFDTYLSQSKLSTEHLYSVQNLYITVSITPWTSFSSQPCINPPLQPLD